MSMEHRRLDFIPGTLCDERVWAALTPLLEHEPGMAFNFIALHEARDRERMRRMIAERSAPAAHLVAFSMGAYLALEHALAHPGRVKSLVLIANSAKGLAASELRARERIVAVLAANPYAGMSRTRLRELLHPAHLNDAAIVGPIEQMALDLGKEVLLAQFAASLDRPDLMGRLDELRCPVLIVGAADDRLAGADDLREMAARLRQASLRIIEHDCGHMIPLEAPRALADEMLAFYRTLARP